MSALNLFPNLIFQAQDMPRMTCLTCGSLMKLSCIEPASTGYDLQTFECDSCELSETYVVEH
jgi:transcription elongation factor Elf1